MMILMIDKQSEYNIMTFLDLNDIIQYSNSSKKIKLNLGHKINTNGFISSLDIGPSNDHFYIIECISNENRKLIHQYLESFYPKLGKYSLYVDLFRSGVLHVMRKCFDCGLNVKMDYRYGITENNIDEYYVAICSRCCEVVRWECNYDYSPTDVKKIRENNAILVSSHFMTTRPLHATSADIKQIDFIKAAKDLNIYKIHAILKKKRIISKYVNKFLDVSK